MMWKPDPRPSDRGQLLIGTAFVLLFIISTAIVAVATVAPVENPHLHEAGAGDLDRVTRTTEVLERAPESLLIHENRVEYTSQDAANGSLITGFDGILDEMTAHRLATHGISINTIREPAITPGYGIIQPSERAFTNVSGAPDWSVATTTGIRNYTLTVDPSSLSALSEATAAASDAFRIRFTNESGATWTRYIGSTTQADLAVIGSGPKSSAETLCTVNGSRAQTIRFVLPQSPSPPPADCYATFPTVEGGEELSIEYVNADNITGQYRVIIADTGPTTRVTSTGLSAPGSGEGPRYYHTAYAMAYELGFRTTDVSLDRSYRVAPVEVLSPASISPGGGDSQ